MGRANEGHTYRLQAVLIYVRNQQYMLLCLKLCNAIDACRTGRMRMSRVHTLHDGVSFHASVLTVTDIIIGCHATLPNCYLHFRVARICA